MVSREGKEEEGKLYGHRGLQQRKMKMKMKINIPSVVERQGCHGIIGLNCNIPAFPETRLQRIIHTLLYFISLIANHHPGPQSLTRLRYINETLYLKWYHSLTPTKPGHLIIT